MKQIISEDDLFEILSDSHFMNTNQIKTDEIEDLVSLAMSDLGSDERLRFLSSQLARLSSEVERIEDSINSIVAETINNLVKKPEAKPAVFSSSTEWFQLPVLRDEGLSYLAGSN